MRGAWQLSHASSKVSSPQRVRATSGGITFSDQTWWVHATGTVVLSSLGVGSCASA